MLLKAETDIYGHAVQLTSADLRRFLDLIDGYMKVPYTIHEIRQDNVHDLNGRVDIEVCYNNEKNQQVRQKLLILNNELIDGKTFHKRYDEWYGEIIEEQEKAAIQRVSYHGGDLRWIDKQTPNICLAAVRNTGLALKYVKEQTEEICLAAVQDQGWVLSYVKEQTPALCLAAVNSYGMALQFVKEQTPEICMAAVQNDPMALKYVKEQTEEICLEAVKQYGYALQYVRKQTPEIIEAALAQKPDAKMYIKETVFNAPAKKRGR